MTTVIVHPEPGLEKLIAQELLALADSPYQVEYVMWPKQGFRIPEALYDRWVNLVPATVEEDDPEPAKPVKRQPGRPKKKVEGQ